MIRLKDQISREVILPNFPKRIVSLVPSQTELLVDLGLDSKLVGITKFCVHPEYLKKTKTSVGGTKQIKLDKIKALKPDIILCNKEENTKSIVEACEAICPVHVSDITSIKDCLELIKQYGNIFNCETISETISLKIENKLKTFSNYIKDKPQLNVAYFIWKDPWMVAASNTYISYILKLNNYNNVFLEKTRYPQIKLDELYSKNLDIVFLSSEPFPFKEKHKDELLEIDNSKIKIIDGEMFSWYGTRLLKAFDYFKVLRDSL